MTKWPDIAARPLGASKSTKANAQNLLARRLVVCGLDRQRRFHRFAKAHAWEGLKNQG
jgi:hypothetical protein